MRVRFGAEVPEEYRDEIRSLIEVGAHGISTRLVEYHVRMKGPQCRYVLRFERDGLPAMLSSSNKWIMTQAARHRGLDPALVTREVSEDSSTYWFSGWADRTRHPYRRKPKALVATPVKATQYVVLLRLPYRFWERGEFPVEKRYHGLKTSPTIRMDCWQDWLISLTAHETFHVKEFRTGKIDTRNREVRAEKHALATVERFRDISRSYGRSVVTFEDDEEVAV